MHAQGYLLFEIHSSRQPAEIEIFSYEIIAGRSKRKRRKTKKLT